MEGGEEVMAEGGRRNDEEEGASVEAERLGVGEAAVVNGDEFITERGGVGGGKSAQCGFREVVVAIEREGGEDWLEDGIIGVAVGPGGRRGKA